MFTVHARCLVEVMLCWCIRVLRVKSVTRVGRPGKEVIPRISGNEGETKIGLRIMYNGQGLGRKADVMLKVPCGHSRV